MKLNIKFIFFIIIINNTIGCKYAKSLNLKNPHINYKINSIKNINRYLTNYDVTKIDWESVISGCHASFNYEKRLANFYIRTAAHDALAIHDGYGGPDGSILLNKDELSRSENNYDSFTYKVSKNAIALSKKFGTSIADIIAVCGAYAVTYLGGPVIISNNTNNTILVGRIDSNIPNPSHQLVPADANTDLFNKYSIKFNFTLEEFTALLGSHTIIDDKTCLNTDHKTYCDPLVNSCTNISMFTWDNFYYNDLCNRNIIMEENSFAIDFKLTKLDHIKNNLCKFTSKHFKDKILQDIEVEDNLNVNQILGINKRMLDINNRVKLVIENNFNKKSLGTDKPNDLFNDPEILFREKMRVTIFEDNKHKLWPYTVNDAWLGQACQNKLTDTPYNKEIRESMLKFQNNTNYWNEIYIRAYNKMINNNANWVNGKGVPITGKECDSGYKVINKKKNMQYYIFIK